MTVTGKTVGENIKNCSNLNPEVIRPVENPYSQTGGIAILKGNLAPDSAVVKRSAVAPEMLKHEGPARYLTARRMPLLRLRWKDHSRRCGCDPL